MSNMVIAIDGPAASGKSTVAELVAEKVGAHYINTGNMYRAAALAAINNTLDLDNIDENQLSKLAKSTSITYTLDTNGRMTLVLDNVPADLIAIRSAEVSQSSSKIATSKAVRKWLVDEQRKLAKFGAIVMEGRDIGTKVFPDAKYKFFLTASPEVRAIRRILQDKEDPSKENIKKVAKEIAERDKRDSKRKISPLRQADDAILVDSSDMNIDEVVECIAAKICGR